MTVAEVLSDIPPVTCNAIIGRKAGTYGEEFVFCTQQVGLRGFWAQTAPTNYSGGLYISYCAIEGHEANVRRRFAEKDPPRPLFLHEDPAYTEPESADPITAYKKEAERVR